jgi:hypothetical protein
MASFATGTFIWYMGGSYQNRLESRLEFQQGCLLSLFLSLLVIDWIMRLRVVTEDCNNGIQLPSSRKLVNLDYADDLESPAITIYLKRNHQSWQKPWQGSV